MEHYFTNNENLKSELRDIKFSFCDYNFLFKSDNGVFSKNKIDYASMFLVETCLKNITNTENINSILDVGCGYGFIGITLSKVLNKHVDMVDINKRAVHLCDMNISINKVDAQVFLSNIYESVTNKYDLIITNPPIRAGKEVVRKFLLGGYDYLNDNGILYFVMRKDHGVKSMIKELENKYNVTIVNKDKGFYIVSLTKHL